MYGAIPDVVISKPPRNNQLRVVVALGVGVMIGALGTAMMLPALPQNAGTPPPVPSPVARPTAVAAASLRDPSSPPYR